MSKIFSDTNNIYNRFAKKFVEHFERKLNTSELDKFLSMLPATAHILDAGCGSARDTAYFIEKGRTAIGIDLSTGLLEEAKKIHPEVPTQQMSLLDITFPPKTFDGVWCKAALLHLERKDIPQVLKAFHMILKDKGVLFIQTKEGVGEGDQPVPFEPSLTRHFTFFELEEMKTLLSEAGFTTIESFSFNGKQRSEYSRDQDWIVLFARKNR